MDKEQDENTRYQLDQEFDSIRGLLFEEAKAATTGSNSVPLGRPRPPAAEEDRIDGQVDQSYDQFVRELAFEKRAKPKDRTKTEEELALEEKEALERAEESRLQRMMGIEDDSGENEDVGRKSRKRKRERGGDDLEDDFIEGITTGGLGAGLGSEQPQESSEGGTEISADEQESSINFDDENDAADKIQSLALSRKTSNERRPVKQPELPFTFPCPMSHHELLSILDNVDDEGVITVIQRIRSLHHPSLSKDNPAKLQVCYSRSIRGFTFQSFVNRLGIHGGPHRSYPSRHVTTHTTIHSARCASTAYLCTDTSISGRFCEGFYFKTFLNAQKSHAWTVARSHFPRFKDLAWYGRAGPIACYWRGLVDQ